MQQIKDLILKNKKEIFSILSIFLYFLILLIFFGNHLGHIIIDCGREVYIPEQMLNGKILYKDLFNIFGPLAYQINACFYNLFGISINTLRLAGEINALLIIYLLYGFSRLFTSREISWIPTVFIITVCTFSYWVFNYIFPYTYSMVYAFSAFLLSVLFLLIFYKKSKPVFLIFSWFFIGVSFASKLDYISYIIFLSVFTIYMLFRKKIKLKHILLSGISFLSTPILCFSVLFLQGLTLNELLYQSIFIKKYAMSESLNFFYKNTCGLYPSLIGFLLLSKKLVLVLSSFTLFLTGIYFSLKYSKDIKNEYENFTISIILSVLFFAGLFFSLQEFPYINIGWLPVISLFLYLHIIYSKFANNNKYLYNNAYILFFTVSLLASAKSFFMINLQSYGTFTLPLLLISVSIFIAEYLPKYFVCINQNILKKSYFIAILLCIPLVLWFHIIIFTAHSSVSTKRGFIYAPSSKADTINQTIDFINLNVKPHESIWIIPEGIMINFLTKRPYNGFYENVTEPYIQAFGEEKIISDIDKNPPDYIMVNNRDSIDYGYQYICKDYGKKICEYVRKKYTLITTLSGKKDDEGVFYMIIYKHLTKTR